ncbi:MAG TPA: tRNA uridine-5-carboxymethylaminomethyl(34) synthesis GTPase MnmE, partial [bacterium]|nr:tRNA uridine-5-carboxymethylaminomethyl(34) synthesis GTPase MnmE [bacterium]
MIDLLAADPIVAQATPAGAGAVGIIRVSGAGASAIVGSLLGPADRGLWEAQPTRILQLYTLHDPATGAALDEALVVRFVAPHSFTGEEVVEIQGHGSPVVMDAVVQACVKAGARLAERGEFSYRAFRNGKLDLSEAEGLQALAS